LLYCSTTKDMDGLSCSHFPLLLPIIIKQSQLLDQINPSLATNSLCPFFTLLWCHWLFLFGSGFGIIKGSWVMILLLGLEVDPKSRSFPTASLLYSLLFVDFFLIFFFNSSKILIRNVIFSDSPKPRSWFGPNGQYNRELPRPSCRERGYTHVLSVELTNVD
jgi:hypothetical protein